MKKRMKKKKTGMTACCSRVMRNSFILAFLFLISYFAASQDFGFGFDEDKSSAFSFKASGNAKLEFPFYFKDYEFIPEELFKAKLNLELTSKYIEAVASVNLNYYSIEELGRAETYRDSSYTPLIIDEVFLRAFLGPFNIEAGYRKLSWGRADSSGPLDVTNPVDFTDLRYITDIRDRKIARPMLHVTWNAGSFSKLEGVFIPNFAPHRFASEGRWAPSQFTDMQNTAGQGILLRTYQLYPSLVSVLQPLYPLIASQFSGFVIDFPKTNSIKNFQTGLRFTTTVRSIDIGAQYYYGTLFRPGFTINGVDNFIHNLVAGNTPPPFPPPPYFGNPLLLSPELKYTRFHQFGIDYAQVIQSFNVRAELAFNLTEDYNGSDGSHQNPFIAWSFGFDRDIIWGINLNMQINETIRLFNSKVNKNPVFDCEAGTNVSNTRLTTQLVKTFLKDNLEAKAVIIWDFENADCYIIPQVTYSYKSFLFNITAGFFAGDKSGELGQYRDNSFIRLGAAFIF